MAHGDVLEYNVLLSHTPSVKMAAEEYSRVFSYLFSKQEFIEHLLCAMPLGRF